MIPLLRWTLALGLLAGATVAVAEGGAPPEERPIDWKRGPATVDVGRDLAQARLGEGLVFAGAEDTQRLLKKEGNRVDGSELGMIAPSVDGENWFIVFEWADVGFVKDDERNSIDADGLLKSITEGTEEANEERKKDGVPGLHVLGWAEAPHYDPTSHHLTWAIRARSDSGHEVINHNVRVLGRSGVMSITLVDDPEGLARAKPRVDAVLAGFSYKGGKTYAEWVPGDKLATYGLTALVAAGAGAAAVKTGLLAGLLKILAKFGKAVLIGVAGAAAASWRFLKGFFGRKAPARPPAPLPPGHTLQASREPPPAEPPSAA
jgi:uncharacterized membrane-anchored protein